jgi:hypothetical protein
MCRQVHSRGSSGSQLAGYRPQETIAALKTVMKRLIAGQWKGESEAVMRTAAT